MNIGIFGGAFNPVHNGHIALAKHYIQSLNLDKLILIPTADPPHKSGDNLVDGIHRVAMLQLATADIDCCTVSTIELERKGKSYSYDTICRLKQLYPNDKMYMIIGSDQYFYFQNWYRADDILDMVTVVTAAREDNEYAGLIEYRALHPNMKNSIVSNFDVLQVSSTQIRDRMAAGESIDDLVPYSVKEYIKEHGLYV
ncbi:MAG: nicotinate (nicotinamide) nucleotide adenylyltransferase [Eubacterium sp.]